MTAARVMMIIRGRSFQNGRPSWISSIRFIARPNAPTYPEADHRAPAIPMIYPKPAEEFWVSCSSGALMVSATEPAPMSESTPTS